MKILKNIFGSKPKQNTKYEPNTLAEMNGSPDLRLATAKEKEVDIPLPKNDEVRKIEKKSTKSNAKNASTPKSSVSKKAESDADKANKKTTTKAASSTASQKVSATKSSTSKATSDAKENTVKSNVKKTSETKKSAPATAKKAAATAKSSETKSTKSTSAKTAVKTTAAKEVKKEVKPAATSKKTSATIEKKVTAEKKSNTTAEKKTAAPTAKKQTVAKSSAPVQATKTTKSADKPKKAPASKAVESKDTDIITESKATRSGKFEIKKSKDGRFVFNLYASNNVIVATSQVYSSSTSAMNGIKSVISNAASAQIEDQSLKKVTPVPFPKWEIYQDKGEQYRFRLCASNGSCVVHSQGYTSKANCKKGIESIIKFASDAEITKVYLDKK